MPFPHLHIGPGVATVEFKKKHLPTARIALEQVLRLVVNDFGITPIRAEWSQILAEAQKRFETWRTWH